VSTMHPLDVVERHADADAIAIGDELLTVHDAARFLNVSVSWVYEHTREDVEDRLPFVKLGKSSDSTGPTSAPTSMRSVSHPTPAARTLTVPPCQR